ncbi:UNVERIFIED_CONTAM: hypothetical protein FKN15_034870 [Acipenser sinensis]
MAVRAPGPRTGAEWGHPRAAAVLDWGLAWPPYRRAPLMAPVSQPPVEASCNSNCIINARSVVELSHCQSYPGPDQSSGYSGHNPT